MDKDKSPILQRLRAVAPNAVLKTGTFGRARQQISIWVEMRQIRDVCEKLAQGVGGGEKLDWLENLSVMEIEEALVLSYFARSRASGEILVVRCSAVPTTAESEAEVPSVSEIWPSAAGFEQEAAALFGIRFTGAPSQPGVSRGLLPEGWRGFPMRKSYVFPEEFGAVTHSRKPEVSS